MFNFIFACWQALKIKYKKFIPFIFTFIFFFSPFTVSAAEVSPDAKNEWFLLPFNYTDDFNQKGTFDSVSGTFNSSGGSHSSQYRHFSVATDSTAVMPVFERGHSYLFYLTFTSVGSQSGSVSSASIRHNWGDWSSVLPLVTSNIVHNSSSYANGTNTYTTIWQLININTNHVISTSSQFQINFGSSVATSGRIGWAMYALDISDSTESEINDIITAINTQTDFIVNGDSSTGGIVSGANSSKSELESIVSDYQEIENSMLDNFSLYQSDILTDLNGWSWGGLSVCANWVGDTMTSYFQNMGDFKQYIIYPLLLGIALFFIGRGSSIIGHLYRKPTSVHTDTVVTRTTVKNGNTSNTVSHTDTYRSGGVLRK